MVVTPRRRPARFSAVVLVALFGIGEFGSWVLRASGPAGRHSRAQSTAQATPTDIGT